LTCSQKLRREVVSVAPGEYYSSMASCMKQARLCGIN
jgi:hypothetical protein